MTGRNKNTWITPEQHAGPFGGQQRRCRVIFPDGKIRMCWAGIPDTFFSIPAHAQIRGKYVAGFITCRDDGEFEFNLYHR